MAADESPAAAREVLDPGTRRVERVLLETRLVSGLPLDVLDAEGRAAVPALVADGLVETRSLHPAPAETRSLRSGPLGTRATSPLVADRLVLTRRGRLLADAVVRSLLP